MFFILLWIYLFSFTCSHYLYCFLFGPSHHRLLFLYCHFSGSHISSFVKTVLLSFSLSQNKNSKSKNHTRPCLGPSTFYNIICKFLYHYAQPGRVLWILFESNKLVYTSMILACFSLLLKHLFFESSHINSHLLFRFLFKCFLQTFSNQLI